MGFLLKTEEELDALLGTKTLLTESNGHYGCHCLLYEGDLEVDKNFLDRENFYDVVEQYGQGTDIGTIAVAGNLKVKGDFCISNRLMLLFVTGNVEADSIEVLETEVFIGGDLIAKTYCDRDSYMTVKGVNHAEMQQ